MATRPEYETTKETKQPVGKHHEAVRIAKGKKKKKD